MDNGTPKIRFGIAPSMSARISEQEHRSAGSGPTTRIAGGTSARIAEEEERARRWAHESDEEQAAGVHPYGVSLRAQGGRPCTIEELMSAESAARYGQSTSPANQEQDGQVVPATALASQDFAPQAGEPQATVEREVFRSLPVKDRISATTGEGFSLRWLPIARRRGLRQHRDLHFKRFAPCSLGTGIGISTTDDISTKRNPIVRREMWQLPIGQQ